MRVYVETVPQTKENGAHYRAPSEMPPKNKAATNESPIEQSHKDSSKRQLLAQSGCCELKQMILETECLAGD